MAFCKNQWGEIVDSDDEDEIFFNNLDNLKFYLAEPGAPESRTHDDGYMGNIFLSDSDDEEDWGLG